MPSIKDRMERLFGAVERALAHWSAVWLYLLWCATSPKLAGEWFSNFSISVFTGAVGMILISLGAKGAKAVHAKLDEMIAADAKARDDLVHIEDRTEAEIEARRR